MATKKKAAKKKQSTAKTVKISEEEFYIIKKFVDANNFKLGKFVTLAALEKIGHKTRMANSI